MKIACFDIGGTFIKCGICMEDGSLFQKEKLKTPDMDCRIQIPELISKKVREYGNTVSLDAVGICSAGRIDTEKGVVEYSANLKGYSGTHLAESIQRQTGLPTFLENDVNAMALGEAWKGAGKNHSDIFCITIGTGVGGAILMNGNLYSGSGGGSGEIGHMIVEKNGVMCECGRRGCLQGYCSLGAFFRRAREHGKDYSSQTVMQSDPFLAEEFRRMSFYLSIGIANIVHLLNPALVVLGGGVLDLYPQIVEDTNRNLEELLMESYKKENLVVSAVLGNDAGMIGACKNVLNRWRQEQKGKVILWAGQ